MFNASQEVYEPAEDSFFFAENLCVKKNDFVLDMGTGCGILGIIAAENASHVIGIDINPYAVRCAKENAKLNHVNDIMLFLCGDLFSPLKKDLKFDLIIFNAPYLPVEQSEIPSWLSYSWSGGNSQGRQVIDSFIAQAHEYLKNNGRILLLHSVFSSVEKTLNMFKAYGLTVRIVSQKELPFFETLFLIEAVKV